MKQADHVELCEDFRDEFNMDVVILVTIDAKGELNVAAADRNSKLDGLARTLLRNVFSSVMFSIMNGVPKKAMH